MRFITITAFALVATLNTPAAEAQTLYTCGDGTVRNVQTIVEMVAGPPVVSIFDRWGEPQEHVELPPVEPRQAYLVTVELFNAIYTAEAFADAPENFDPTRLDDRETISTCVSRDQMILDRSNGTDFRATIVRAEQVRRNKGTR